MSQLRFSPVASDDLLAIGIYIAGDSPERALTFMAELEAQCIGLLETPEKGARREELSAGLRLWPYKAYNVYYRAERQEILIIRILHSALNIQADDLQ